MQSDTEFESWYRPETPVQVAAENVPISDPNAEMPGGLLHHAEAYFGAFFATLLSCFFVLYVMLPSKLALILHVGLYVPLVFLLTGCLEGPFLVRLWSCACSRRRPIGPAVAQLFVQTDSFRRFLLVLWWLAHIAVGMLFVITLEISMMKNQNGGPGWLLTVLVSGPILFGMSVCCNVYIALFVKALFGTDSAVQKFWAGRLVVDVMITIIALLIVHNRA